MTPDDRPAVMLFTAATLPVFRDTLAKLHPLTERLLRAPCYVHAVGSGAVDTLFDALPEGPVDPEHHPPFWAMLSDVHKVLMQDDALRLRVRGVAEHGRNDIGYHTTGSHAEVRAFFARHARVIDVDALVRERHELPRAPVEATLRDLDRALRINARSSAARQAAHDYLHGGGDVPAVPAHNPPRLAALFRGLSPLDFNEAHLRALDLVAQNPAELRAAELGLAATDPLVDLHHLWRGLLRARGVDDETMEVNAVEAWATGAQVNSRAWWVLSRMADDPEGFVARLRRRPHEVAAQRRALYAACVTWSTPRFREGVGELLARAGRRLHEAALLGALAEPAGASIAKVVAAHLSAVLRGRRTGERRRVTAAVDEALLRKGDEDDE